MKNQVTQHEYMGIKGNLVVETLNASVCINSFKSTQGEQLADLYTSVNECAVLVGAGSCAPVNSTFAGNHTITF